MQNAIAIIPARGGSKRIPRKNIKLFHGKPLIAYSIELALKSQFFKRVLVTTNDKEIAKIAREYGAETPFIRPEELSNDISTSGDAVTHALEYLQTEGEEFAFFCTLYPTAPFLQMEYLVEGYERLKNSDAKMTFSVTSMPFPIQRTFNVTDDGRCQMFTPEHFKTRSQDLKEAYQDAGQFYWERVDKEFSDIPFGKDSIPIVLPRELVHDIDTPEDFRRAELMYSALNQDTFDEWNNLKKRLNKKQKIIKFSSGNIYFMSVGKNIGYESYGKEKLFLRPVLVYKKLSKTTFLGIPLTSKHREGSYYFSFHYKKDKTSTAMFNQIRVFDIRRSEYLSGHINKNIYKNLEFKLQEFMKLPHLERWGMANEGEIEVHYSINKIQKEYLQCFIKLF